MKIIEPKAMHNIYSDVIKGENVKFYEKKFSQIKGIYENNKGINDETLMYTVYSYENGEPNQLGNLYWGLTILEPVYVNGECNMTRGHFHSNTDCAEFYFGIEGEGLLLLMNEEGEMWAEKVFKGSLHYIDGKIAHRLVNVGDTKCSVGACWPSSAGHNYEAIEKHDFPNRVFKINNELIFKER